MLDSFSMDYKKTVFENGLRVITVSMKDNPTVTVLVLVATGSNYETKEENGLSHFLEHMCFQGTKKRPRAIDIANEIDSMGAQNNAFTSNEFTGYYAKASSRHAMELADIVSDIYLNPTLQEPEIEREKGVIIEEINMYNDLPQRKVQDVFTHLLYGDQPAGRDIAGTKENVSSFKRSDFISYRDKFYTAPETVVIVSGNFDEAKMLSALQKGFKDCPNRNGKGKLPISEKQNKPEIILEHKQTDQSHFVLGVRTFDVFDKRNSALKVLAGILGSGMSSRLFEKMRNQLGICYYVNAGVDTSTDHGFFSISAGVKNERLEEALKEILVELSRLKKEPVSEKELEKAKEHLVGNMYLGLESSDSLADFYGLQEILKKPIKKPDEIAKEIKNVTAEDIFKLANTIFKNEILNLAVIGPEKNKEKLEKIFNIS